MEVLIAKRMRTNMQSSIRQLIMEEEEKARALEQEIADMQYETPHQQPVGAAYNQNIYHPADQPKCKSRSKDSTTLTGEAPSLNSSRPHHSHTTIDQAPTPNTMATQTLLSIS